MEQYIMFDKLPQKIEAAVSLFRYLERSALVMNPEGFYVAFSGGSVKIREKEFIRYPKYKRAYIRAFDRMVDARTAAGKTKGNWPDGESVFNWWMYGRNMAVKQVEGQIDIGQYDMAA